MKDKPLANSKGIVWIETDTDYFIGYKDGTPIGAVSKALRNQGWYWSDVSHTKCAASYEKNKEDAMQRLLSVT